MSILGKRAGLSLKWLKMVFIPFLGFGCGKALLPAGSVGASMIYHPSTRKALPVKQAHIRREQAKKNHNHFRPISGQGSARELAKASLRHPTMTQHHSLSNRNARFFLHALKSEHIAKRAPNTMLIDDENVVWLSPNSHRCEQGRLPKSATQNFCDCLARSSEWMMQLHQQS